MITLALRFGPLLVALVVALLAYGSWTFGDPPTWTLFGAREEARVVSSEVVVGRAGNGTIRYEPQVMVAWPPEVAASVPLGNLKPSFYAYRQSHATEIAAGFEPGETIIVRVYDGRPHADRIDWFGLLHATFLSFMTVVVATIAWVFFLALGPVRRRDTHHRSGGSPR